MWTRTYKISLISCFYFLIYIRNGIAGSYHNSMFNYFRNLVHTIFYSTCTILHSHLQCTSVHISSHVCQHLLFFVFVLVNSNLNGWYIILLLIYSFLMISYIVYPLMRLLYIFFGEMSIQVFVHYLTRLFNFYWDFFFLVVMADITIHILALLESTLNLYFYHS